MTSLYSTQVAAGPLALDGETLTGVIVTDEYEFDASHATISNVTDWEVDGAGYARLTGTARLDLIGGAWVVFVDDVTSTDLSDVTNRGGIVWARPSESLVGFDLDAGGAIDPYEPTYPSGLFDYPVESIDEILEALLSRTVAGVAAAAGDYPAEDIAAAIAEFLDLDGGVGGGQAGAARATETDGVAAVGAVLATKRAASVKLFGTTTAIELGPRPTNGGADKGGVVTIFGTAVDVDDLDWTGGGSTGAVLPVDPAAPLFGEDFWAFRIEPAEWDGSWFWRVIPDPSASGGGGGGGYASLDTITHDLDDVAPSKTNPVDNDQLLLGDSENGYDAARLYLSFLWANYVQPLVDDDIDTAIAAHAADTDPHGDRAYAAALFAANDALVFKGSIDCSANPNYPAADAGHTYRVSIAGKIGGASGTNVEAGDLLLCTVDATSAGNQATVGSHWTIGQTNIDGQVIGPAGATDSHVALFDGTSGHLVKDGGAATTFGLSVLAAANAAALRTLAGTVIGADVQAFHANLTQMAGLSLVADKLPYANGTGTLALTDFTTQARALLDDTSYAAMLATLGAAKALVPTAVKTGSYTAAAGDYVPVDTTSGTVTITLPASPSTGDVVEVKRVIGATNAVTVACQGSHVLNAAGGSTSSTLSLLYMDQVFVYAGSNVWLVATSNAVSQLDARYATVASPAFTGTPTAPTAAAGTNTTQVATTAFVKAAVVNRTVYGLGNLTGTVGIDLANGTSQYGTLTGNTTFTMTGFDTSGTECEFVLGVIQDSTPRTITWPAAVKWPGGVAPTISTASAARDVFVFRTRDGGTTIDGFLVGRGMA